jgi:hypothetical protein
MAKRADRQARRRYRTVVVITAGSVIAILMSACAGGTVGRPAATSRPSSTTGQAARGVQCRVARSDLLTSVQLPGFTQFVADPQAVLPVHYIASNEPQFVRDYVCGEFYGFITNRALTGLYRQQNTSYFEQYGYRPGKWPYVPLRGQIVADLSHQVLEIYESLYQFNAAAAVKVYLPITENSAYSMHRLTLALAPGAVVLAHLLGPDPSTDEHAIYIAIPHGDYAIELEIQGGRSLTWADAEDYWKKLAPRVPALGG